MCIAVVRAVKGRVRGLIRGIAGGGRAIVGLVDWFVG